LVACASPASYSAYRKISLETPNCSIAECRLKYEGESTIWEKSTPQSFSIGNIDKNLFVACYAKSEENEMVQSIIVKPGDNEISHPIDCSVLNVQKTELTERNILSTENNNQSKRNALSAEDNNLKPQRVSEELINTKSITDSNEANNQTEFSLNESILLEVDIKDKEEVLESTTEESQEEKILKENIAQQLLDQIESLYKQGLITKEAYEKEIQIINNMND